MHSVLLPYESSSACCFRDIDKVDDLMQDITEQQELAQEISDAISKPVGFGEEFDDVSNAFQILNFVPPCLTSSNKRWTDDNTGLTQ